MIDKEQFMEWLENAWDELKTMEFEQYADYVFDAITKLKEQNEKDKKIDPCKYCQEWDCDGCEWLKFTRMARRMSDDG